MRLLIWHCAQLSYTDERPSTRPPGIHTRPPTAEARSHDDVLLVFTTIEEGDSPSTALSAIEEVRRTLAMVGPRPVVVMPFAHLSRNLAPVDDARQAISRIVSELRREGLDVEQASFGFHKSFELSYVAHGHPGSVAYREMT